MINRRKMLKTLSVASIAAPVVLQASIKQEKQMEFILTTSNVLEIGEQTLFNYADGTMTLKSGVLPEIEEKNRSFNPCFYSIRGTEEEIIKKTLRLTCCLIARVKTENLYGANADFFPEMERMLDKYKIKYNLS